MKYAPFPQPQTLRAENTGLGASGSQLIGQCNNFAFAANTHPPGQHMQQQPNRQQQQMMPMQQFPQIPTAQGFGGAGTTMPTQENGMRPPRRHNQQRMGGGGRGQGGGMNNAWAAMNTAPTMPQNSNTNNHNHYNNANYCWSCGCDITDWHNSQTCNYCKPGHQFNATLQNMMQGAMCAAHKVW